MFSSPQSSFGGRLLAPTICFFALLTACADETVEQSSEAFSAMADVHTDPAVIQGTVEIDKLLIEQDPDGNWSASVFDPDTVLLERESSENKTVVNEAVSPGERSPYYGDLHVHTEYSFDGYAMGTQATPYDAYRFAKGEAISNPGGFDMQLSRPLDFYAVTDHAMFLGLVKASAETVTEFSQSDFAASYHGLNDPHNYDTDFLSMVSRLGTFASFLPSAVAGIRSGDIDRDAVLKVVRSAWEDTVDAAEEFNDPGNFTTFVAYEYTASTLDMGNLHRNVIFRGSDKLPREPFSRFHSVNPEDLWDWMDELREMGIESMSIPHNSNGSNGQMFKLEDWAGNPLDDAYAEQRMRNEPIVEITQVKGTSETHPLLSNRDEFAGFEIMPYRVATNALSAINGSYVREALLNGLSLEQSGITNPYKFGFIGSSDTHSGAAAVEEDNYVSKLGLLSSEAVQRGSVPYTGLDAQTFYWGSRILAITNPSPRGGTAYSKLNGEVYINGATPTFGASGLAAAWAEENTRDSLYEAFRRKEVFATSGPRIKVRFFAGADLDESMLDAADGIERAYESGVTMGGDIMLSADDTRAPNFLVMASADPLSAPLQRLQVIKGWIDAQGETHEEVMDIACAGGAAVNPETNRCPDNGARVDISTCSINPETGAAQLSAMWSDQNFDPTARAFYYARVIENPTCRWSTWDAVRAGVPPRPDLAKTLQERAWSSPINVIPAEG
ncbi:DUF3604 domain-containing protein [Candidatus Paraluminiphilus aquimaris]|uniref:DUF3604 domain-containing protein n=2 Tax=Candidatus Paraluminiphilus aquimaris TaxID=2518994 RepID=A0ABY6Q322_9GAMM|nr:DUF3604 domain-containing protein [Candidatus Paraluminiphilus aquimaris]